MHNPGVFSGDKKDRTSIHRTASSYFESEEASRNHGRITVHASTVSRTLDLLLTRQTLYHWATEAVKRVYG
ncbi:hypothetical protein PGT21_004758, partial [Puccinia graminis f. sp. tritici]